MERYRETPAGLIPCSHGEFVRIDEACLSYQWHAFHRMLNWLNSIEDLKICRKDLQKALMALRPDGLSKVQEELARDSEFRELLDRLAREMATGNPQPDKVPISTG